VPPTQPPEGPSAPLTPRRMARHHAALDDTPRAVVWALVAIADELAEIRQALKRAPR